MLPQGFRFGVATAGFQVEGGYNGPGEPKNNWYGWEAAGRVEPSGSAIGFWERYEDHLDLVAGLGCDSFRFSIEWARVEPEEGATDEAAVARYRAILGACHDRGLTPLVTLHHFTHPWWLGEDLWLRPDAPERFARWVRFAVEAFGDRCDKWVTVNEANVLAIQTYLLGSFPPGRVGAVSKMADALDHLVAAHVLGYEAIHARQPGATVATDNFSLSVYELDRLALDLLVARAHGVGRDGLVDWLAGRRAEHDRRVPAPALPGRGGLERVLRAAAARALPLGRTLPAATAAVFDAGFDRLVDVAQLDFYVPAAADHFALPGRPSAGGRSWSVARDLWEDRPDPVGLVRYLEAATEPGLEVWVVENGMCNLVRRGRSYPRTDHWTRDRYLAESLGAVVDAVAGGVPVTGYWHWTLADNYEWGTYEPRFGLYGVDRERANAMGTLDAMGVDAAGAYRELISGLRAGDRSVLAPTGPGPR